MTTRIADAPTHSRARELTVVAQSHPSLLGEGGWQTRAVRGQGPTAVQGHVMWVVPLTDPGEPVGAEVMAWVTTSEHVRAGTPPDAWLTRLADELDGKTLTLRVAARGQALPDSGWAKAIRDAEARHGLRSHPDAPVLAYP